MARTHKDQPTRVKELQAMRAGLVSHAHHKLGRPREFVRQYYSSRAAELSRSIPLAYPELIAEYTQMLADDPSVLEVERIPSGGYYTTLSGGERLWVPRSLYFAVTVGRVREATTAYCTDAEHYDPATKRDTRDGALACCVPKLPRGHNRRCGCCRDRAKRKERDRSRVRDELRKLAKAYAPGEELDEEPHGARASRQSYASLC